VTCPCFAWRRSDGCLVTDCWRFAPRSTRSPCLASSPGPHTFETPGSCLDWGSSCVSAALSLSFSTARPSSIPAARPTSYVFAEQGWLQPMPPPSITRTDVTLHWTPYPAARWYDVTVLTKDLAVVHRAFMRQTTELTVPRTALPRSKLLWQVTVQPEQGERVDSSAFVLDLAEAER